jgi:hypothetical protein
MKDHFTLEKQFNMHHNTTIEIKISFTLISSSNPTIKLLTLIKNTIPSVIEIRQCIDVYSLGVIIDKRDSCYCMLDMTQVLRIPDETLTFLSCVYRPT